MSLINRLTLHHGLVGFAMGLFLAVKTLFLKEKGFDLWQIGLLFGAFGATTALLELPLGAVADIHGRVRVYGLSRLLVLMGILLAAVLDTFWGAMAAITGIHLPLLGWLFHEGDPKQPQSGDGGVRNQLRIAIRYGFNNPRLRAVFMTAFVVGLVLFSIEAYWQPRVTEIAPTIDYAVFGWLATGYFLAAALGPLIIAQLVRRWPVTPDRLIQGIILILGPLMAVLALQTQLTGYAPAYLAFMLVLSMANAPFEMLMAEEVPSEVRSTLFSVLSLSLQLGGVVMAYGLSFTVKWIGIEGLWLWLGLGLATVLALRGLTGFLGRRLPRVEPRAEAL